MATAQRCQGRRRRLWTFQGFQSRGFERDRQKGPAIPTLHTPFGSPEIARIYTPDQLPGSLVTGSA